MPTTQTIPCKVCNSASKPKHTIKDITYYQCERCQLLFNTYWDDKPLSEGHETANEKRREERWPAGEADQMYQKGWESLEYLGWPIAWWSRKLHATLKNVPGYESLVQNYIKKKFHKHLDFGCGHGIINQQLRERDNFDSIGLDPFSPVSEPYIIREQLEKHNFPDNEFDAIFSIETLEHIPNIIETFSELRRILKTNHPLLVQTRRIEDPDYQKLEDKWFYLEDPTTHITIYSEPAMREIAKKAGFKNVSFRGVRYALFIK